MIASRTFIVRFSQTDHSVVLENSLTRERVGLQGLTEVAAQIEHWLRDGDERQGDEACTRTEAGSGR